MSKLRKVAFALLLLLATVMSGTCIAIKALGSAVPTGGVEGPEADALAHAIEGAIDAEAWAKTGAVEWTFADRNTLLWDRQRMLVRVLHKDTSVMVDLTTRQGKAWKDGQPVTGEELTAALSYGWAAWANDSFWLNPLVKLFDDGVSREKITLTGDDTDGKVGLLVSYSKGGVTPGDRYLWILDARDRPIAWRMWTTVFPVSGIRVSWDDWVKLDTGAYIATKHRLPGLSIDVTGLRAAATLKDLVGADDPFAPLYQP
jgi:hypothetical protein